VVQARGCAEGESKAGGVEGKSHEGCRVMMPAGLGSGLPVERLFEPWVLPDERRSDGYLLLFIQGVVSAGAANQC